MSRPAGVRPPFRSPLLILVVFLACLVVGRGLLLVSYWSDFDELSAWGLVSGFLWGLRFDLSITLTFIGLPLLMMAVPASSAQAPAWQQSWGWLCWGVLVLFVLTIGGEKSEERTEGDEERKYHLWERRYGSFQRSFTLPRTVKADDIRAHFDHGILRVMLPKVPEAKGRKIEIQKQ